MESSKPSGKLYDKLYDTLRKKWVKSTPEELIRQRLVQAMVEELGYAPHLIAIEKELSQLPHLQNEDRSQLVKRRIDLLIYSPSSLQPLLMVECKAVPINSEAIQQILGYNCFVKAPFISLANGQEIVTGSFNSQEKRYQFRKGLPHYEALLSYVKGLFVPGIG